MIAKPAKEHKRKEQSMKKLPKIILATCLCGLLCFSLAACSAAGTEPGSAAAEETAAEETAGWYSS